MQDAFPIVIAVVVAVGVVIAIATLVRGTGVYDDIRAGDFIPRQDSAEQRAEDIAQMREALGRGEVSAHASPDRARPADRPPRRS
jgi:hypothetical protein